MLTLHRVIDIMDDPLAALESAISLGFHRILTSGGAATAPQGAEGLQRLHDAARGRIEIMAGGGIKGGVSYGETDDWGYKAVKDRVEIHDLHATMLHMLGIEHERSTFRFGGRDVRLTDVHGHVIREILA